MTSSRGGEKRGRMRVRIMVKSHESTAVTAVIN